MSDAPLILTLKLDDAAFARFDALRKTHFPAALNYIPAHLTLFHHLPGERLEEIVAELTACAPRAPMALRATGLRKLGRGTAVEIGGAELTGWRERLARSWAEVLTAQDRQGFRPHVTVQNKVDPANARALYDMLSDRFSPFNFEGVGVFVWRYLGGPWALEAEIGFSRYA